MKRGFLLSTCAVVLVAAVGAGSAFAAGWTASKRLSVAGEDAGTPFVAAGPTGAMLVAWEHNVPGGATEVRARRWAATGNPGPILNISTAGVGSGVVHVGTAADAGISFVSWLNQDTNRVQIRRIGPTGTLGPIRTLSDLGASAQSPDLAVAPNGRAIVTWFQGTPPYTVVARQVGADGVPGVTAILGTTVTYPADPRVAIARNGRSAVTWRATDGANVRAVARLIAANGTADPVLPPLSAAGQNIGNSSRIGIADDGTATVVWERTNGTNTIVQSRRLAVAGTLGAVLDLSAVGQNATSATVAVAGTGVVTAAWLRSNGSNFIAQSRRISSDGTPGPVVDRSAVGQNADGPTLGASPNGTVLIAWHRWNGSNTVVQTVRVAPGGSSGPVKTVSPLGQDGQWASVAVSKIGVGVAAWYGSDGSNDRVAAARYLLDPPNTRITRAAISAGARSASFRFRGAGGAGALRFECRLRGAKTTAAQRRWSRCRSPKSYASLPRGSYVFEVRARDASGRADPTPAKRAFTV